MKFELTVKNVDSDSSWTETYNTEKDQLTCLYDDYGNLLPTTAEEAGNMIIDYWNSTLRPHDKARVLLGAVDLD